MRRARVSLTLMLAAAVLSACGIAALAGGGGANRDERAERREARRAGGAETATLARSTTGFEAQRLRVGGLTREYLIYVPQVVQASGQPAPLFLAFHGGGGNAANFVDRTGLAEMAERYGFVVVAPQGEGDSWNSGGATPVGYAERSGVDDLGFVTAILTDVEARFPIDGARVYAAGLSAGGMMTYHLACDMPERFRAVAVVASTLTDASCAGLQGLSLLHIHGTQDENIPLEGGRGRDSAAKADWPSPLDGIADFRAVNACAAPGPAASEARDTTCETSVCEAGREVTICLVDGGGHAWPGIEPAKWQKRQNVYVSPYFFATDRIATFFLQH